MGGGGTGSQNAASARAEAFVHYDELAAPPTGAHAGLVNGGRPRSRNAPESAVHAVGQKGVSIESDFGRSELQQYCDALHAELEDEQGVGGVVTVSGHDQSEGAHAGGNVVAPCTAPLHTAVRMGWLDIARQLVDLGFSSIHGNGGSSDQSHTRSSRSPRFIGDVDLDRYGHRAIDIACMLRWSAYAINAAFGDGAVKYCVANFPHLAGGPTKPNQPYTFPPPEAERGGWIGGESGGGLRAQVAAPSSSSSSAAADDDGVAGSSQDRGPLPSTCDFDVWEGPFTETAFLEQYASVSRPVLMRGLMGGAYWNELRRNWTVDAIGLHHPTPWFKPAGLPFSQTMAQQYGGKVTVPAYVDWLLKHRKADAAVSDDGGAGTVAGVDANESVRDLDAEWTRFMAMVHEKEGEGWVFDEDGSVLTNIEGGRITLLPPPKPAGGSRASTDHDRNGNAKNAKAKAKAGKKDALPFIFAALPSQAAQTGTPTPLELAMNGTYFTSCSGPLVFAVINRPMLEQLCVHNAILSSHRETISQTNANQTSCKQTRIQLKHTAR